MTILFNAKFSRTQVLKHKKMFINNLASRARSVSSRCCAQVSRCALAALGSPSSSRSLAQKRARGPSPLALSPPLSGRERSDQAFGRALFSHDDPGRSRCEYFPPLLDPWGTRPHTLRRRARATCGAHRRATLCGARLARSPRNYRPGTPPLAARAHDAAGTPPPATRGRACGLAGATDRKRVNRSLNGMEKRQSRRKTEATKDNKTNQEKTEER
jgi:hypothetical protein